MHKLVFLALLLACCGYAWLRGGGPEKAMAAILALGTLLTFLVASASKALFESTEISILAVDAGAFAAMLVVALRADRFWPIVIAALQLVALASHAAMMLAHAILPWAYAFLLSIWAYPMLAVLAVGTWRHQGRVREGRAGLDWAR